MAAGDIVWALTVLLLLFARQADAQNSGGLTCWVGRGPDLPTGSTPQRPTNLKRDTDWSWESCYIRRFSRSSNYFDDKAEWIFTDSYNGTWRTCAEELRYWDKINGETTTASWRVVYCCDSSECNYSQDGSGPAAPRLPPSRTPSSPRSNQNFSLLTQPTLAILLLCLVVAHLVVVI